VDNGITVPHAKTNVVTRPSLAALRLSTPVQYNAEGGAAAEDDSSTKDSFGRSLYKNLMNGVSHMLPFVVGGGIFVFPVVDHAVLYCVALAVGSVLGAVILSLVKKTQPAEAK